MKLNYNTNHDSFRKGGVTALKVIVAMVEPLFILNVHQNYKLYSNYFPLGSQQVACQFREAVPYQTLPYQTLLEAHHKDI